MIIWSPSSWSLWKQCPTKYRIKQVERWKFPRPQSDGVLSKLAIPGLVVDKLLQLWLHRNEFDDKEWFKHNFDMIWSMVTEEIVPTWSEEEKVMTKKETILGLGNAVKMIDDLQLTRYRFITQASFFERLNDDVAITGAADLLLIEETRNAGILVDFKNNHSRPRVTKDQLLIYQLGLEFKLSVDIERGGYLMYNPRLNSWKWFKLHPVHKQRMIEKLIQASELVSKKEFDFRWNQFTCLRFCEVRFSCELFQSHIKKPSYRINDNTEAKS